MQEVRPGQTRIAAWLGIDVSGAQTAAEATMRIFNAPIPPSLMRDAAELGIPVDGLCYGAAKEPIQKARVARSKEMLAADDWKIGSLIRWSPDDEPAEDVTDTPAETEQTPESFSPANNLWVVVNVMADRGKVTIKPFGLAVLDISQKAGKAVASIRFPTHDRGFRQLLVFRLRDAKPAKAEELILY